MGVDLGYVMDLIAVVRRTCDRALRDFEFVNGPATDYFNHIKDEITRIENHIEDNW